MIQVWISASSPVVRAGLEAVLQENSHFSIMRSNSAVPAGRVTPEVSNVMLLEVASAEKLKSSPFFADADARPIVLLAGDLGRAELRRVLHSGVKAVLSRDATGPEIVAAIEAAAAGLTVLGPDQMDALLPVAGETVPVNNVLEEPLSAREAEVLAMMAEGLVNKEIAARLSISEHTVKFHVSSILGKLGATTRGEAVARGIREGLITI